MRALLVASAVIVFMTTAPLLSDEVKDREPLQGTWKVVSLKSKGKEANLDIALVLIVKGDGMTLKQPDQEQKEQFRFVVDASVTPHAIDIYKSDDAGKKAEKQFEGIVEVKGNELRLCFNGQPGPPWLRPAALEPNVDSAEVLVVLRRE